VGNGVEVLTDVVVLGTTVEGTDVLVDVYGSASNICGSVRFTFTDPTKHSEMTALLTGWALSGTPLTFVRRGTAVSLQDDQQLHVDQLKPTP
jgi:hypothetical protein